MRHVRTSKSTSPVNLKLTGLSLALVPRSVMISQTCAWDTYHHALRSMRQYENPVTSARRV